MKIAEESGELVQWFLAATGQGRPRGKSAAELEDAVDEEIIDLICHALLLAHHRGTDIQAVMDRKWLHRNDTHIHTQADQPADLDHEISDPIRRVRIVERIPTVTEYQLLRASVGWKTPAARKCETALPASLYSVVAEVDDAAVGMARVVGDGLYAMVVDVVVNGRNWL
ncbi:hypothetical protein [Nocardia sp. GAS34]|uniref:hypothetical protein n=1 Tax=unclassified Nocardia TaxID=2637762 RepID=UPI003D1C9C38